jgi:O-antigen/teichoic acid export membrane protein
LITGFSLLGLGSSIVKYLPKVESKSDLLNSSLITVFSLSFILSILYVAFVYLFVPTLSILSSSIWVMLAFSLFTSFYTINILFDDIFVAYRRADFVFIKNTVFSVFKILVLFVAVSFGSLGVYISFGVSGLISILVSFALLFFKLGYISKFVLDIQLLKSLSKFSFGNYLSLFINGLPARLLPIIITPLLGAHESAYFYISLMIANLLYVIPMGVSQSLFAEGSYSESDLKKLILKALKFIFILVIPTIILIFIFGKLILSAFGTDYAINASNLLNIFAISAIFISISNIGDVLLKLQHRLNNLIFINITYSTVTIIATYLFSGIGLIGVGYAFLIGNIVMAILHLFTSRGIVKEIVFQQ